MKGNLHITYRHLDSSDALSALITEKAEELELHCGHALECRVTIDPLGSPAQLKRCRVHVTVSLRGKTLVADRPPSSHEGHDDPYLAVREAFRSVRHELDRFTQQRFPRRDAR